MSCVGATSSIRSVPAGVSDDAPPQHSAVVERQRALVPVLSELSPADAWRWSNRGVSHEAAGCRILSSGMLPRPEGEHAYARSVDVFGDHRVIEWCLAIRKAVVDEIRTRFPESAYRWPYVAGGFSCDAYELPPDRVAIILHHVDEDVVVATPSKAMPLPSTIHVATDDDVEQVQTRLSLALDLPSCSILFVLPSSLPRPDDVSDELWLEIQDQWQPQVSRSFVRLMFHVASNPPPPSEPAPTILPAEGALYDEHPVFPTPDDPDAHIWRYLSLSKYLDLISRAALWFSRLDLLGDPLEGSLATPNIKRRAELTPEMARNVTLSRQASPFRDRIFVSCWHMSQHESAAMWSIYAPNGEGVSIRSTFRRLVRSIGGEQRFHAGLVEYADYGTTFIPESNTLSRVMHKRSSFEHEHELRAVISDWSSHEAVPGISVPVDLVDLIDGVFVAPSAPDWYCEIVTSVTDKICQGLTVERSDMDRDPIW